MAPHRQGSPSTFNPAVGLLSVGQKQAVDFASGDLVVTAVRLDALPRDDEAHRQWEARLGNIWFLRVGYLGEFRAVVTGTDVLFHIDTVDPRPGWSLVHSALALDGAPKGPVPKITIWHGRPRARPVAPDTR